MAKSMLDRLILVGLLWCISLSAHAASIDGSWVGALDVGSSSLRVVFNISRTDAGTLKATLDSPDQGAYGIPVDRTTFDNNELHCEIKAINGAYVGKLDAAAHVIDGTWSQAGRSFPLVLRPAKNDKPKRPQEPVKPYPYAQEEVRYENTIAHVQFAGTLTKPFKGKKFPAVLLITGSGPQNRDEEIMGHKPFLIWADYLTRRGIAVLRVDDRGVGESTGSNKDATTDDFVQDALAGVAYLKSRPDIESNHIGLIGHSEGGLIAPIAAAKSKDVAFIVMLAGPGVPGAQVLKEQRNLIAAASGESPQARAFNGALQSEMFNIVLHSENAADATEALSEYWSKKKQELAPTIGVDSPRMRALDASVTAQFKVLTSPWMRHFLRYDPATALKSVKCPVLAIGGSKDLQVSPTQNLPAIRAALKAGGNKDFTVKEMPGLNHLFQKAKTGAPSEYGKIEETVDPSALKIVGDWVVAHAK